MSEHAPIAPSSLGRLVECPGSLQLCRGALLPDTSGEEAEEGDIAHGHAASWLGAIIPREIPKDMLPHVRMYVDYCTQVALKDGRFIEKKLNIPMLHPTDCWGTPDFRTHDSNEAHVVDFKYGTKWVTNYWQLIAYMSGYIVSIGPRKVIKLTYVQPRANHPGGPIRTLELSYKEFKDKEAYLRQRIDLALTDKAPLISGSHCYRCPRQYDCPANTEAAANVIEAANDVTNTVSASAVSLGRELELLERSQELLKERIINVKEVLEYKERNGERSGNYEFTVSKGHRKFTVKEDMVKIQCELEGIEAHKQVLKSPAELEREGLDVSAMAESPRYVKLKRIDFDRAKKVFKI